MAFEQIKQQWMADKTIIKAQLRQHHGAILLAPYKIKLQLTSGEWVVLGRAASHFAQAVIGYGDMDIDMQYDVAMMVGSYSEIGANSRIFLGGDTPKSPIFNGNYAALADIKEIAKDKTIFHQTASQGAVHIGSNVMIGSDVLIFSGVTIGDGAIIRSGSVVREDVPPFAVVAGNPAIVVEQRFDQEMQNALLDLRWWDLNMEHFYQHMETIGQLDAASAKALQAELSESAYQQKEHYLVFARIQQERQEGLVFQGAQMGETFISSAELPEVFQCFISQLRQAAGSNFFLIKDIFHHSGLDSNTASNVA